MAQSNPFIVGRQSEVKLFDDLVAGRFDEGAMWPTAFALKELTAAEEARISALVKKAAS